MYILLIQKHQLYLIFIQCHKPLQRDILIINLVVQQKIHIIGHANQHIIEQQNHVKMNLNTLLNLNICHVIGQFDFIYMDNYAISSVKY